LVDDGTALVADEGVGRLVSDVGSALHAASTVMQTRAASERAIVLDMLAEG
jgi:hypothetical protein